MSGPPTAEEIAESVASVFDVYDTQYGSGVIRFRIRDTEFKDRFARLAGDLERMGVACMIKRDDDGLYVDAHRIGSGRGNWLLRSPWVPRISFAVVICFVMIDGYYRTVGTNQIINIGDPLEMAAVYTAALLGILGVHELGHMAASRIHRIRASWPYFIPGIPVVGIPTFGALIVTRGLMINRKRLFDVAIAGPVAGLVVAVAVAMLGAATAPVIDPELGERLREDGQLGDWSFGEPLLVTAALATFGKGGDGSTVLMTPLMFAAWVGLFLTFANMMPAGQLDGGHLFRSVLGHKRLRLFTYVSAAVLFMMNFWFVAIFILVMGMQGRGVVIMDDITRVGRTRVAAYAVMMAMAVLCAPISENPLIVAESLLHQIQQISFAGAPAS